MMKSCQWQSRNINRSDAEGEKSNAENDKKAIRPCFGAVSVSKPDRRGNALDDEHYPDEVVGDDWRVTGVVRDSGIITRSGEDIDVLVCIHAEDAAFYYDSEDQVLFDFCGVSHGDSG